jgi:two-component system nitrogen regulation response regulator NtrX
MAHDILVVDDETDIREMIAGILDDDGYGTRTAHDSDSAIAAVKERKPSLVILDIWLMGSRLDGLALLDQFKETDPDMPVVIISGHGNIETAVSAIKRGAYDYIEKPFKADRLVHIVERAWKLPVCAAKCATCVSAAGKPAILSAILQQPTACVRPSKRLPQRTAEY